VRSDRIIEGLNVAKKIWVNPGFCVNSKPWSDMYDECNMETKKMILSHIMKAVPGKRDYEIEIGLTVDIEPLGLVSDEPITADSWAVKSA